MLVLEASRTLFEQEIGGGWVIRETITNRT
jgi:hypothetical protein